MGVVNITPDSFSDGGEYLDADAAVEHARELAREGADIIDIGGESTRPGAEPVSASEELKRIMPALEGLRTLGVAISVDTSKPDVMRAALAGGADMINDIWAFRAEGAFEEVAPTNAAVCVMHMQGQPRTMQVAPHYDDVVGEVGSFLKERALAAKRLGIDDDRIVIDPGFGFGKSLQHNLCLLRGLKDLAGLGWPVLVGLSRKSMLGTITGRGVGDRVHASVAAALLAVINGARIVRVHDVGATRDAIAVFQALHTLS
ncbi:MAG: dihydropteroate synthase [Betaproteobacteria bacterium]|nr:MAG: dihydropteroate synthase [Betaproteobacteria bacterium]